MPQKQKFLPWLRDQRTREDAIGEMARFYYLHPDMSGGASTMRSIVRGWAAMEKTCEAAIAEWKRLGH
jgi:hypothetical protein